MTWEEPKVVRRRPKNGEAHESEEKVVGGLARDSRIQSYDAWGDNGRFIHVTLGLPLLQRCGLLL